ncbi:MAG: M56 family metallopeptidase [Oscillibacter sp.]|nr:M56 family metallopeptidase [Oscillibacter sp.]
MKEILLTSSVLILALLALRRIFREKISRRVQYALWGLVLVRLLIPVSLPALDFSVLTMAEPVQETISARLEAPAFAAPAVPAINFQPSSQNTSPAAEPSLPGASPAAQPSAAPAERAEAPAAGKELTLTEVLRLAWLAGTAAMTVWLLAANLAFAAKLRRNRVPVRVSGCRRRAYLVESGLVSPCLFGVLRPAIYLTPAAMASEESLRHVLAHEETHARHLDPLWSLLRGVCLAVYWFDPLVWIAASASRTDCELACDEGAIRRLGEEERLAYGRTLLSLVPIRRLPGNPLLSATTMSSDKKRLRDRITRIAEKRRTRKLALCAMVLLTAGACLVTFAGCAESAGKKAPDAAPTPVTEKQDGPLTAAELQYFNENFFNGDYMNIRNQFLSSLYDDPADIDLFELFYCGSGQYEPMTDEEWTAYGSDMTDTTKVSTAAADALLTEYMGLTLDETKQMGLNNFTYSPEYDAYYYSHGDTNYRMDVTIPAGVREGNLVRLYYNDTFYADGWKRVTLRETESGGHWFVSNAYCEKPVIPTVYPVGEPLLTIPLTNLTGYEPQAVEMTHHSGDCEERFVSYGQSWNVRGRHVQGYRSTDGRIYAAEITESAAGSESMVVWEADCFLEMPNDQFSMDLFTDLFGRDGFVLSYTGDVEGAYRSYYSFDKDGTLCLLCTVPGYGMDSQIMDLDGDGVNELLCSDSMYDARLYFQQDGRIYEADIAALLKEAWPENLGLEFDGLSSYARSLPLWTYFQTAGDSGAEFGAIAFRTAWFDGENLLVYKVDKTAVDHVTPGVTGPEDVITTLRQVVQEQMDERKQDGGLADAGIDDWRIVSLAGPWYERYDGLTVEIYRYNYELHAAAPERVGLAGGMYVDEDGWVSPGYPDCDYIYFRVEADGSRTYLFHDMSNDMGPDSEWFHDALEEVLVRGGYLEPGPGQAVQMVWDEMQFDKSLTLTLRTADGKGGGAYPASLGWNRPGDLTTNYTWEALTEDQVPDLSGTASLTVGAGANILTFYDPQLVSCSVDGAASWYRAACAGPEDPFACEIYEWFRRWYDEAEINAMEAAIPVIPDDGRSREEIARTWVEAYEGTHLKVTSGSRFKCTYMDIQYVDLDLWNEVDITELLEEYAESRGAEDVFLFNYSAVFVPEGDPHWFMAGNTGEYEGDDAPEGALQWWMMGYMYLMEDGWRCDGVGTGP